LSSIFTMDIDPRNVICIDTEFTDLLSPELLSLGLSSGSGAEHYAELDLESQEDADVRARCCDFVAHGAVLEQWGLVPGSAGTYAEMAQRTADWLSAEASRIKARSGQPAILAYDYFADLELLIQLLEDAGHGALLRTLLRPTNVGELTSRFDGGLAAEAAFQALGRRGLRRHHALADAVALRAALYACLTGRRLKI